MRRVYADTAFGWIPPANYHVTLRFFGELTTPDIDRAVRLVEPVAAAASSFEARAVSARPLPNARQPNVIALPIESSGRLEMLAAELGHALNDDFGPPDKPFKAHLSVIRCRRGGRLIAPIDIALPLAFECIALFESTTGKGAPRYTAQREFPLGVTRLQTTPS